MRIKAAHHQRIGREAADACLHQQAWLPSAIRRFAALGPVKGHACVENRVLVEGAGDGGRQLLVVDIDVAVAAAAAGRPRYAGRVCDVAIVLAIADEGCSALRQDLVDADVALVVGQVGLRHGDVVICKRIYIRHVRGRQGTDDDFRERRPVAHRHYAGRVGGAGNWVAQRHRGAGSGLKDALPLVSVGQRYSGILALYLAVALEILQRRRSYRG